MKIIDPSIQANERTPVACTAAVLFGIGIIQLINTDEIVLTRIVIFLAYAATSFALLRAIRFSRQIALVMVFLVVPLAIAQLAFSALGTTVAPVPPRVYASFTIAAVVLATATPALVWLWRNQRRDV